MSLRHTVIAYGLALFALLIVIPFVYLKAQTSDATTGLSGTTTRWAIQAYDGNAPMTPFEATSANGARAAAQKACQELGGDRVTICLNLLKARSFASLTASGPNWAAYFLDVEFNAIHQRGTYVAIYAIREQ
jgi:hypothetical protein